MIVTGALRPGDRLPPESELAGALGLSRNSLREAVRALSLIRVLDVRQGDGTYVTGLGPELLLTAVGFAVDLHPAHTAPQFLAVRRILEPAAAALAAARITEPELDALHALLDVPADTVPEAELLARDLEFHRRIARAAGTRCSARCSTRCPGPLPGPALPPPATAWPRTPCANTGRSSRPCGSGTPRRPGHGCPSTWRRWLRSRVPLP